MAMGKSMGKSAPYDVFEWKHEWYFLKIWAFRLLRFVRSSAIGNLSNPEIYLKSIIKNQVIGVAPQRDHESRDPPIRHSAPGHPPGSAERRERLGVEEKSQLL